MEKRNWTESELLVALKIYCELEFGQFHSRNQRIIEVAEKLGRTPSSLSMKLCNFASLDPAMEGKGLKGASKADAKIIESYLKNPEDLVLQSESEYDQLVPVKEITGLEEEPSVFEYETTEKMSSAKIRTVQSFFRASVLSSYHQKCAICAIDLPGLLIASHIIPWSQDIKMRANPKNGIALCSIHDKAFDKGFISIDCGYKILVGEEIKKRKDIPMVEHSFVDYEGREIHLPFRFLPAADCLEYHQKEVFQG